MTANLTKEQAKDGYRSAWCAWCLTTDPDRRHELEKLMDFYQPFVTPRSGPEWDAFKDTLPGFNEFWKGTLERVKKTIEEAKSHSAEPEPDDVPRGSGPN